MRRVFALAAWFSAPVAVEIQIGFIQLVFAALAYWMYQWFDRIRKNRQK